MHHDFQILCSQRKKIGKKEKATPLMNTFSLLSSVHMKEAMLNENMSTKQTSRLSEWMHLPLRRFVQSTKQLYFPLPTILLPETHNNTHRPPTTTSPLPAAHARRLRERLRDHSGWDAVTSGESRPDLPVHHDCCHHLDSTAHYLRVPSACTHPGNVWQRLAPPLRLASYPNPQPDL